MAQAAGSTSIEQITQTGYNLAWYRDLQLRKGRVAQIALESTYVDQG